MSDETEYRFLPWVRSGAATAIHEPDRGGEDQPIRAQAPVSLRVNGEQMSMPVRLYGPGEVIALDRSQIVHTEPAHGTTDFEPNYFAAVELRRPDLPWLFTPARADADGRLRPWLCLVVVRAQTGVEVRLENGGARVLEISAPARPAEELPELADSWAWAHAQVVADVAADTEELLATGGRRTLSRLLCLRRLRPDQRYLACLVPTFEAGRRAGLGEPVPKELTLAPAWRVTDDPAQVRLPVYYHWEFATGPGGDFESLVRLLEPRPAPAGVGVTTMDISAAGPGLPRLAPDDPGAVVELFGALRIPGRTGREWPEPARAAYADALADLLDAPERALREGHSDPVVAPPRYGRWHAAETRVAQAPAAGWFRQLNLDPRLRVGAAAGTAVVRRFQESLMASAWRQIGEVTRANRLLQQAQLARCVGDGLMRRHLRRLPTDSLLRVTSPAHRRVRPVLEAAPAGGTAAPARVLGSQLAAGRVPPAAVSSPYRRVARPRGPLARRAGREVSPAGGLRPDPLAPPVAALNSGEAEVVAAAKPPAGLVSVDEVSDALGGEQQVSFDALAAAAVDRAPRRPDFGVHTGGSGGTATEGEDESPAASRFRDAAGDQQALLFAPAPTPSSPPDPLALDALRQALLAELEPEVSISTRALSRVHRPRRDRAGPAAHQADDPVTPVQAAPSFPQPMYRALREVAPQLLLPGLEQLPADTLTLVQSNPDFIAGYLVGLNHEMGKELLWRGYPTDQRGTMFRRFWSPLAEPDAPAGPSAAEPGTIEPIHTWPGDQDLAQQLTGGDEPLVLLLRGELLRRYPDTLVYAVPAVWTGAGRREPDDQADERYPQFQGTLGEDITFVGFRGLTAEQARGSTDPTRDPGWFFALEQQPTHARFGVTAGPDAGEDLRAAATGAHLAAQTLRRAIRVVIHAADLLPSLDVGARG